MTLTVASRMVDPSVAWESFTPPLPALPFPFPFPFPFPVFPVFLLPPLFRFCGAGAAAVKLPKTSKRNLSERMANILTD